MISGRILDQEIQNAFFRDNGIGEVYWFRKKKHFSLPYYSTNPKDAVRLFAAIKNQLNLLVSIRDRGSFFELHCGGFVASEAKTLPMVLCIGALILKKQKELGNL